MQLHTRNYRDRFDENAYRLVESEVMMHVFSFSLGDPIQREMYLSEERPNNILESVRCTAHQIVGTPGYHAKNGVNRLVITTLVEELAPSTIAAITTFLAGFQVQGCAIAQDYQNTMITLHSLKHMEQSIIDAVRSASTLHGSQGQMIYECLTAAQYLMQTAQAALKDDPRYSNEKFSRAVQHIEWANTSANAYRPDVFNNAKKDSV
ncbi:MAG: hypothetical protein AAFN11_06530 [Chloroflexota bacterium]